MLNVTRFLLRHLWAATALTVVVLAVTTFTLRYLLLPQAGHLLPSVERLVSDYAARPVEIAGFSIDWLGREPVLSLQELQVYPQYGGDAPQLQLSSLYVSLDPWALLTADIRVGRLALAGIRLSLLRHADGRISVEGFSGEDDSEATGDNTAVALWLLEQPRLGLYSSQVELRDEASGRTLRFNDVNMELENDGEKHRLSGAARLPAELGRQLSFVADFQGDISDSRRLHGEIYLKGRALRLAPEPAGLLPTRLGVSDGETDLEFWSHWKDGRVTAATLDLEARGVESHGVTLDALGGLLNLRREGEGWRIDGERLHLAHAGQRWESDYLALELDGRGGGGATAQRLDVEPLTGLLLASGVLAREHREMVETLRPSGRVEGLELAWEADGGFALRGDLQGWSNRPWREIPGIDGLNARVDGRGDEGRIALNGDPERGLSVEFPKLFRHPIALDRLAGTLQWHRDEEGLRLTSEAISAENAHIATRTRLDALIPTGGTTPILDLQSDFHDGDGAQTFRYLPVGIMPPEAVSWLDRAIVGGRVTAGSALFHGDTGDFPFLNGEGRFEVRFNVEGGILDYREGWPRLEELEAEIAFINQGMHAVGSAGRILGGEVRRVTAHIPDLNRAVITIDGEAEAPAPDLLSLLRDTPLREQIGGYFEGMSAEGRPGLDLNVVIPLIPKEEGGGEIAVSGSVDFQEGRLDLGAADLTLSRVNGRIGFDNHGIRAEGVKARYRDRPLTIGAYPLKSGGSRIAAEGRFPARELIEPHSPFAASRMEGEAQWRLDVDLPGREESRGGMQVAARLRSDLEGVAIHLPAPLAKGADEISHLDLTARLGSGTERSPIRFQCGDNLRGVIQPGDAKHPRRAAIALGGGEPPPLPDKGLAVGGEIREMALASWIELWNPPSDENRSETPEVTHLDLHVAQLEAFGHLFNDQRLSGGPRHGEWSFQLEGPDARGSLSLPTQWDRAHTLRADLEQLVLRPYGDQEETVPKPPEPPVDPRDWPAIELRSAQFTYDGLTLGSLELAAAPEYDGLELHNLVIDSSHTHLDGRGGWSWRDGRPESWLAVRVDSRDLQSTLATFGYPRTIAGGSGSANLNLNWPGDPGAFSLAATEGEASLDFSDVNILELDPGAGRVLGLLRLDLAGAVREGIQFDAIRGRALLGDGAAVIPELELLGNTADLAVTGEVQLVEERYDLLVDLTPNVSSSLPLVGALASANPMVGAALFIGTRLLDKEIDKAAARRYSVKGAWDNPQLEKLTREERDSAERALPQRFGKP